MEQFDRLNQGMETLLVLTERIKKMLKKIRSHKKCPNCRTQKQSETASDLHTVLLTAKDVQRIFDVKHSTYYRWIEEEWLVPISKGKGSRHFYEPSYIEEKRKERNHRQRMKLPPKE